MSEGQARDFVTVGGLEGNSMVAAHVVLFHCSETWS